MPDSKISNLPLATEVNGRDILLVIKRSGNTTFTDKKIEGDDFFGNISSNTVLIDGANLSVSGNTSLTVVTANTIITTPYTPVSSTVPDAAFPVNKITFDANYIYVKVAPNLIKRVALSSF